MDLLKSCEAEFHTNDLYAIFGLPINAAIEDGEIFYFDHEFEWFNSYIIPVKKRFRKLIKENHPDKAPTGDKLRAESKFKLLHKIYDLLTDPESKKFYDETGNVLTKSWCRNIRPITESILTSARENYVG